MWSPPPTTRGSALPACTRILVGESEGRSVLDAARAARGLKAAAAASKVLVFGHSQGGHAALFAGELAASYAPELRVLGVAAGAPGSPTSNTPCRLAAQSVAANGFVVMIVEGFHAAYPQFDPAAILTPDALAQASIVDQKCALDVRHVLEHARPRARAQPTRHPRDCSDLAHEHRWQPSGRRAAARCPGNRRLLDPTTPHRLVRGTRHARPVTPSTTAGCGCGPRRRDRRGGRRRRRLVRRPRQRRARDQHLQSGLISGLGK